MAGHFTVQAARGAGGLALVQDFLNTGAQPQRFPDLLATASSARRWSTRAARAWSRERQVEAQATVLIGDGLAELGDLRGTVEGLVTQGGASASVGNCGEIELSLSRLGEVCWLPTGDGWRWWSAAVGVENLGKPGEGDVVSVQAVRHCHMPSRVLRSLAEQQCSVHAATGGARADELTGSRAVAEIHSHRALTFFHPIVSQARR